MAEQDAGREGAAASLPVILYGSIFFLAMIGHELALEAASNAFSDLEALASVVTLFQFGFCVLLPIVVSRGDAVRTLPRSLPECIPYVKLSCCVYGATALATKSLVYVSYPTKVVFKSAKLIPTMIVSTFMAKGSNFGPIDYLAAAMLCAGAAGYSYGSGGAGSGQSSSFFGIALLTISIVCDALVPNLQKKLMTSAPSKPPSGTEDDDEEQQTPPKVTSSSTSGLSAPALMVNVNAVGFLGLLCTMTVTGSLFDAVTAAAKSPLLFGYLSLVGVGLSTAVLFYTKLIKASGPVVAVAVATLRKVATVVLSYVVFPKPMLPIHVVSGLVVLGGIMLSTVNRQRAR